MLSRQTAFYFITIFTFFLTGTFNTIAYFDSHGPYRLLADTLPKLLNIYVLLIFTVFKDRSNIPTHLVGFRTIVISSGVLVVFLWVLWIKDIKDQNLTALLGNATGMLQGLAAAWYVFIVAVPETMIQDAEEQEMI